MEPTSVNYKPYVPPYAIPIPETEEERKLLVDFIKGTSKDFVEIGERKIKNFGLLGFDLVASWSPILKEALTKDYQPPQIILDSRGRMWLRWEKIKQLCEQVSIYSQERFELDQYTSLVVLETVCGMEMKPEEKQRYQEILQTQRERPSPLVEEFEKFRRLPAGEKARVGLSIFYEFAWDKGLCEVGSMTYNQVKYRMNNPPPSFETVTTYDVTRENVVSLTIEQIRNPDLPNPYNFKGGKLIYVGYEYKNDFILKFAPRGSCNHAELARLPCGKVARCKIAGEAQVLNTKILEEFGAVSNKTGHLQVFGDHLPKLTTHYFHQFGFTEMNKRFFQSYQHPFLFDIHKGHIKGIPFHQMMEGVEYQYVCSVHDKNLNFDK